MKTTEKSAWLLLAPILLGVSVFFLIPFGITLYYSVTFGTTGRFEDGLTMIQKREIIQKRF